MYDEIDLKHVSRIMFWTGTFAGFFVGFTSMPITLMVLEYFGKLDKALDFLGIK